MRTRPGNPGSVPLELATGPLNRGPVGVRGLESAIALGEEIGAIRHEWAFEALAQTDGE